MKLHAIVLDILNVLRKRQFEPSPRRLEGKSQIPTSALRVPLDFIDDGAEDAYVTRPSARMPFLRVPGARIPVIIRARHSFPIAPRGSNPRLFTQNSQLLLLARHTARPQLPYLSQPSIQRRISPLDQQILRLISTENRSFVRQQVWLAAKWSVIGWTFLALASIAFWGLQVETHEQRSPTPSEWSFVARYHLRSAREQSDDLDGNGIVDWVAAGAHYLRALGRLEDLKRDGKGVLWREVTEDGGDKMIPDVGTVGPDISGKSWAWRQGYFEVLMGMARASEQTEEVVKDLSRHMFFPKSVVIGPSNPDPRPVTAKMPKAPLEEDCVRAFDPPEKFYMRILTGNGFTTKQKLDAAWSYATWLESSGQKDTADEMYKWGVDIAASCVNNSDSIIDHSSLIFKPAKRDRHPESASPSANLLRATTLFAAHRARMGDASTALPILLSVMRARREAPHSPALDRPARASPVRQGNTDLDMAANRIVKFFTPRRFPPPPPSGDDPYTVQDDQSDCEDSELMLYIGEIVFASSPKSTGGLAWTKEAVNLADRGVERLLKGSHPKIGEDEELSKCKQCLRTGVANWESMLQQMASEVGSSAAREGSRNAGWLEWRGWFGRDGGMRGRTLDGIQYDMLAAEFEKIENLKHEIAKSEMDAEMLKRRGSPGLMGMLAG